MEEFDFLQGHCADFALALYQEFLNLEIDKEDLGFTVLLGYRTNEGEEEEVLIHAYVSLDDLNGTIYCDANPRPSFSVDELLDAWLEFEHTHGDENAEAFVVDVSSPSAFKKLLRKCYRFSSKAQEAAIPLALETLVGMCQDQ